MDPLPIEIHAIQAASFVAFGIIAVLLPRTADELPIARHFGWLGAFGLLRGAVGFFDMWTVRQVPVSWGGALLALSFLPLFEFARRSARDWSRTSTAGWVVLTSPWMYAPVLGVTLGAAASTADAWAGFNAAIRYVIALPAALGAAMMLSATFRHVSGAALDRWMAGALGVSLSAYGLVAGLLIEPAAGFPVWLPTTEVVLAVTGVPAQMLRASLVLVAAIALGTLVYRTGVRTVSEMRRGARDLATLTATLDRRIAERTAELQRQRELAQRLLDVTPAIILLLTPEGNIEHVNPAFERLTGWRLDDVRGREWFTLLPERDRTRIGELFKTAIRGTATCGNVNAILTRTGGEREIEWYDQVLRDEAGGVAGLVAVGIDVTERRRAEVAADALRQRQRNILDSLFAFVGVYDLEGNLIEANRAPLDAAGLARDDVIGKPFWDAYWWSYSPQTQEQVRSTLARAARGELVRDDFVVRIAGGRFITIDAMFGPLRDANGDIVEVIGSGVDVTDRKTAEESARRTAELLRTVVAGAPVVMFALDREGLFTLSEGRALEKLGLRPGQMVGASALDAYRDVPGFEHAFRRALAGEQTVLASHVGSIEFEAVYAPSLDAGGRIDGLIGVAFDVSERKRAEHALRESETRLRQAQSIAAIGNWELDLATNHLWWSDEIYRIFEIDQSQFAASYDAFLDAIHPGDREAVNAAYTTSLQTGTPYRITHRLRPAGGRVKHVEERCETDFAPAGTPLRSRGTVQDVTLRVEAEEALRASLLEKETLLREVHHRVKNNLQIVSSLLYFQAKKVKHADDIAVLADARNRLGAMSLVHEKLYRSNDLSAVDMGEYIEALIAGLRQSHAAASRHVEGQLAADPVRLSVEAAIPVGMIIGELLTNVFKHAFPDGRNGHAEVRVTAGGGRVEVCVADDGVGLPETFAPKSTESFGWQLVEALTSQLDGDLRIAEGPGTRVVITFPEGERA